MTTKANSGSTESRPLCSFCGKPASGSTQHCSSGCSLASRIPNGPEGLPVTWQLGVALGVFFLVFNQALFASIAPLAAAKRSPEFAGRFVVASLVFGSLLLIVNAVLFAAARPKRVTDWLVWAVALVLPVWVLGSADELGGLEIEAAFVIFNALITIWLARGLLRASLSKKTQIR